MKSFLNQNQATPLLLYLNSGKGGKAFPEKAPGNPASFVVAFSLMTDFSDGLKCALAFIQGLFVDHNAYVLVSWKLGITESHLLNSA